MMKCHDSRMGKSSIRSKRSKSAFSEMSSLKESRPPESVIEVGKNNIELEIIDEMEEEDSVSISSDEETDRKAQSAKI